MKIAVLALLYLGATSPDGARSFPLKQPTPRPFTVIYKSAENPVLNVSDDVPYVVDDENCDEELVDFDSTGGNDCVATPCCVPDDTRFFCN